MTRTFPPKCICPSYYRNTRLTNGTEEAGLTPTSTKCVWSLCSIWFLPVSWSSIKAKITNNVSSTTAVPGLGGYLRLSTTSSATLATSGWDSASSSLFSSSQDISRSSSLETLVQCFQTGDCPSKTLFFMPWESQWCSRSNGNQIEIKSKYNQIYFRD